MFDHSMFDHSMFDLKINYKSTSCRLKVGQLLLESGAALMYYNVGNELIESGAAFCITKQGK